MHQGHQFFFTILELLTRDMKRDESKFASCLNLLIVSLIGVDCTPKWSETSLWSEIPGSTTKKSFTIGVSAGVITKSRVFDPLVGNM